jgi:hypothetical protein
MPHKLSDAVEQIRRSSGALKSIIVTDRDGVELVSSPLDGISDDSSRQNVQIVGTIFSLTHEQCEKLDSFGQTKYIISEFGNGSVLLQANFPPMIISITADHDSVSDGILIRALEGVKDALRPFRSPLATVVNE